MAIDQIGNKDFFIRMDFLANSEIQLFLVWQELREILCSERIDDGVNLNVLNRIDWLK
jgi:hypothetical protein